MPAPKSGKGKRGRPVALDRRVCSTPSFTWSERAVPVALPSDFGPWQTVYGYFRVWSQDWTWEFIHNVLRDCVRQTEGRRVARRRPSWTANRSRPPTRREHAATMRAKRTGAQTSCGGGLSGLDSGNDDYSCWGAGLRCGSAIDQDAGAPVWPMQNHLGRRRLSRSLVNWVKQLHPFGKLRLEVVRRCETSKVSKSCRDDG